MPDATPLRSRALLPALAVLAMVLVAAVVLGIQRWS